MALAYLFDEHLRGTLPQVVFRQAQRQGYVLKLARVGDSPELPLGASDPVMIRWAAQNEMIIVSHDSKTLPEHLADHLAKGQHSPGILIARRPLNVALADWLVLAAFATEPHEWRDRITFVP